MRILVLLGLLALAGCTNHEMVLRRDEGNAVMCHAAAYGLLWVAIAESRYDRCVEGYLAQGYRP